MTTNSAYRDKKFRKGNCVINSCSIGLHNDCSIPVLPIKLQWCCFQDIMAIRKEIKRGIIMKSVDLLLSTPESR